MHLSPQSLIDPIATRRPSGIMNIDLTSTTESTNEKNLELPLTASAASGSIAYQSGKSNEGTNGRLESLKKENLFAKDSTESHRSTPFLRRLFTFSSSTSSEDIHSNKVEHIKINSITDPSSLPRVLILTPMKNSQKHMTRYFALLKNLTYPSSRLSIGILDSDSDETQKGVKTIKSLLDQGYTDIEIEAMSSTLASVLVNLPSLERKGWNRATVVQHNFGYSLPRNLRHGKDAQLVRRTSLARSRNHLLTSALHEDETYCLWIDSDLVSYPPDVIEQLISANRDIVVPNVVMAPGGRSYDLNSWRSKYSPGDNATFEDVVKYFNGIRKKKTTNGAETLELEGYGETNNFYLHHLRQKSKSGSVTLDETTKEDIHVVRLDAVGGAMLLVRAELHRHGLIFPPFVYRGRIETEGLSMMALDFGILSFGLPEVEVIHH
jgi:hypothetical protein